MRSSDVLDLLRDYESRNVTFVDRGAGWPIVWESARGNYVRDLDGKKYLDLTAAFGVAAAGHANPAVVRAGQSQMARLLHAMGDVHPHRSKAELARELSRLTFERWTNGAATGKTIFCNSGFEAVEAALKSALQLTGRKHILAFEGAYHGLGYGTLNATWRHHFRGPFLPQLAQFADFFPFPTTPEIFRQVERQLLRNRLKKRYSAVLVEPVQGRAGIQIPEPRFFPLLRNFCDEGGAALIVDEIFTGFGRTGHWFACERTQTTPDFICLGKALSGGFPISACVGRAQLMDRAWPLSSGEAIHTSTFLGHPVGCAMALANIREIDRLNLPARAEKLGVLLRALLQRVAEKFRKHQTAIRSIGLMAGLEIKSPSGAPSPEPAVRLVQRMLERGFVLLPEGEFSNVVAFTPPLTITAAELAQVEKALTEEIESAGL